MATPPGYWPSTWTAPPPLGKALTLKLHDQGCLLRDGDTEIARAAPGEPAIEPPAAPAWEAVHEARERCLAYARGTWFAVPVERVA